MVRVYARGGTISNARFPDKNRMDRSGDRTVQADHSKADDAADRSRIYGVARKSAPVEQEHKVKERGSNSTSQRTAIADEVITSSRLFSARAPVTVTIQTSI